MKLNDKKIIVAEFNELVPHLVEKFMNEGHMPNFKKLANISSCYITDANQTGEDLNPWIQWVTVHTGLTPEEHGVYRLNEAKKCEGKYIWDKLSNEGEYSLVFGSMNGCIQDSFLGTYLPDPWDKVTKPSDNLQSYFEFIRAYVQGNPDASKVSPFQFLKFMLSNGLTLKTCYKIAHQLVSEKIDPRKKWKRACLLDWIQLDVFRSLYKKNSPKFSTIFSNSTAHIQHTLWAESFPEDFPHDVNKKMPDNPMLDAYKNHDEILGDLLKLKAENVDIAICTALSQQPYTKNTKCFYHINHFQTFLSKLNVLGEPSYVPVMAEQFHLKFSNELDVQKAFEHLSKFEMPDSSYFYEGSNKVFSMSIEENTLHIKCRCSTPVKEKTSFFNVETNKQYPFYDMFYLMDDQKTGIHHPHGIFWITNTNMNTKNEIIPLEHVYNKILMKMV